MTKDAALKRAAEQFRYYETSHRAKGTPDADEKAEVNATMARMCEDALKPSTLDGLQDRTDAAISPPAPSEIARQPVFTRGECVFMYCPHPASCVETCRNSRDAHK